MSRTLEGKVVVITGAAGLLGARFCAAVIKAGGRVAAGDLDEPGPMALLKRLQDEHGAERLLPVGVDITDAHSIDRAIAKVIEAFGRVDALVNNAYPRNARYGRRFEEVRYEDFVQNVGMHAGGYFLASQRFLELFKRQGGGNIVNMASIYGVVAPRFGIYADANMTMPIEYAIIKAGVVHMTRYIASYHRHAGIRCNCISPGGIRAGQPQPFQDRYDAMAASKGMLDPEDICGTLVFLLSDASAFVNGQNIIVDDGWSL
jgi:NAD(P)-dependent dehydrogenase (short-subunit alcohol dehydrogenase family)